MRTQWFVFSCIVLVAICIFQQWWIQTRAIYPVSDTTNNEISMIHWDIDHINQHIEPPPGATGAVMNLVGRSIYTSKQGCLSFAGCLWLDISNVAFPAATRSREERICAIAAHYADQIANAIPGGIVVSGIEREGMEERGALHSVYLVKHQYGYIAVSAGYREGKDGEVFNAVKVNVLADTFGVMSGGIHGRRDRFAATEN